MYILDFGFWCDFITDGLESIPDAGDSLQALDEEISDYTDLENIKIKQV